MFRGMRFLPIGMALCTAPTAFATAADAKAEPVISETTTDVSAGALIGAETSLADTSESDFAAAIVDESGDDHIVTRDAKSGALRYLRVHGERIAADESITVAAKEKDRQKHQAGILIDSSGQPVVWSAGHQFRRDVGSGHWREIDSTIGCEKIVEFRNHLVCLAIVPGKTFNAPKHWIAGIVGGPGAALPWAWRVNTDTLALFGEEQNLWQPVAVIDRDSKVDATGPYDLAVDARDRLHILSDGYFHHAIYSPALEAGKEEPRQFASVVSDPVVVRFTAPYKSHQDTLTAWPGFGMPGPSSDAIWSRTYMTGEAFDPVAAEFTFLLDGWSAHGKAFSTAPDTWLGVWRLHDARGEWVQTLAMSPDSYMTARMAASSNGRLHAAIVRIPKKDGPKTFEYLSYDGATWSTPVQLSLSRPIKSLYDLASNRSGQILIVYASTDGKLVARSIVDRAPAGAAPVVRPEAEPVPLYKSKSGALGLVVPIALSDIGAEATAAGTAIAVADHRAAIVMERTAMGRPMGLVDLEPGERELVSALVTTKWKGALGKRGLDHYEPQLSCELQEFSVTTPGTMFYWDVSTRVQWVLHLGDQQRTVTAASKRRTFVWPSKTLIKEVTVAAMKSASAQTEQAIGELLAAASP